MRTIKTYFKGAPFYIASREIRRMLVGAKGIELSSPLQTRKLIILSPDKIIKNAWDA